MLIKSKMRKEIFGKNDDTDDAGGTEENSLALRHE